MVIATLGLQGYSVPGTTVEFAAATKYKTVNVSACNLSGNRQKNAKVDIGYGTRNYYAYTNSSGQLTSVTAKDIKLQSKSETKKNGRYCTDEAKVKGTESSKFDQGHVIADSLGGVSNAYNITPQASNVNRAGGKQYQIEQEILKAEKAGKQVRDFKATMKYPNSKTQTPSSYTISYKISGKAYTYTFNNTYKASSSNSNLGAIKTNGKNYGTCAKATKAYGSKWKGYKKGYNKEYSYHTDPDKNGWTCGTNGK